MQANQFFSDSTDPKAIMIDFIQSHELEQRLAGMPDFQQNQLQYQQFNARQGELALLHDATGQLESLLVGVEHENYSEALAKVAVDAPPGAYRLHQSLREASLLQWALAQYVFSQYKTSERKPRVLLLAQADIETLLPLAQATFLVRDLINLPAADLGPEQMAESFQALAKAGRAKFKQWKGKELLKENFPAIHAVGRAAAEEPRLLSLRWGNKEHPLVTLVGKGVCFDSGGLDLKPTSAMRWMKKDMGGAAQVMGLAQWIMAVKLPIQLQVYIPAVENAIGAGAFRPGDVLTMRDGSSVEVDNTDAEGRLVLADAIVKACEEQPELIIDFSTLTGAARVAVGTELSALFANDDGLAKAIIDAGEKVEDPVWRLPLHQSYKSMLRSSIADLSNSGDKPYAGAITAALFLEHFVRKGTKWAHFDIMAWNLGSKPGRPEGGEAMAMRAIAEFLKERYASA